MANRGFYELFGFVVVAQVAVGESDPTWNEPPVVVDLVCWGAGPPIDIHSRLSL